MQIGSIFPSSPEWNYCQFRLQLILSHPNVQIISICKNSNRSSFFAQRQNYFKIDAAADATELSQSEIISLKTNSKKGNIFKCGRVDQQSKFIDGLGQIKTYKVLLFKIAVKDSLSIYKTNSLTKQDLNSCSEQYDSIYISTRKQQINVYDHQYFIRSSNQYLWEYEIQYCYINTNDTNSKVKKWNPERHKCQQCQTNKAYWYCLQEKQLFCRECYQDNHKSRNTNNHTKQVINPFNCHKRCDKSAHNGNLLQFYCIDCRSLKCKKCINDINHSSGNSRPSSTSQNYLNKQSGQSFKVRKTAHQIIQVRQLIKQFNMRQEGLVIQLKHKIGSKIKQLQIMIQNINVKYQQKLNEIQNALAVSISELKKQSVKQINRVVSVHIQLKRKFDQVLWMQKFIHYNEQVLDAQSNIKLKQLFMQFVGSMNAEQYFKKIQSLMLQIKRIQN